MVHPCVPLSGGQHEAFLERSVGFEGLISRLWDLWRLNYFTSVRSRLTSDTNNNNSLLFGKRLVQSRSRMVLGEDRERAAPAHRPP